MPKPRPLAGGVAAKRTLAHRLTRTADRLRQFNTRFGIRSRRVFLVWFQYTGPERGEGSGTVLARVELLPTPKVSDATALGRRPYPIGLLPDGSLRIEEISCGAYTEDNLRGLVIPGGGEGKLLAGTRIVPRTGESLDFFYEIVEDARGDDPPARTRYHLSGAPWRKESSISWSIAVEPANNGLDRAGNPLDDQVDLLEGDT